MKFNSILIANRGEIACRIMRTAKAMGLRTVAVFSEADRDALHVRDADDAVEIGPAAAGESYLDIERIIAAARDSGAQAVHPGYGFLSENAAFARACADAGLVFVGPPAQAIEAMGNKAQAKRLMEKAGVPCVPGYQGKDQSEAAFTKAAGEIGFPVMVKAAAGGGGRGMRLVSKPDDLAAALTQARSEAQNAFGSGQLILEKAVVEPRHVEIQVFADSHGNFIHLSERDCSVQRRHQKIVEEVPSPAVDAELRERMGQAAIEAAKAVDYAGAGTVEFLLDAEKQFHFLEMNTRLQVEHPVTEMVTGLDLVEMQIRVAQGEALRISQDDVQLSGHAIEVRLYAEDPAAGFLPSSGEIALWREPAGAGVRTDAGIETGAKVTAHYDPMLAKIIAHGPDREAARRKLVAALGETAVLGVETNRDFLIDVLERQRFADGDATTALIAQEYGDGGYTPPGLAPREVAIAGMVAYLVGRERAFALSADVSRKLADWSSLGAMRHTMTLFADDVHEVTIVVTGGLYQVEAGGEQFSIRCLAQAAHAFQFEVDGRRERLAVAVSAGEIMLATARRTFAVAQEAQAAGGAAAGGGSVVAPMHGRVAAIHVGEGDMVRAGDPVAVVEAMKMQHQLTAAQDGKVVRVHVAADQQVAAGELLVEIEPGGGQA